MILLPSTAHPGSPLITVHWIAETTSASLWKAALINTRQPPKTSCQPEPSFVTRNLSCNRRRASILGFSPPDVPERAQRLSSYIHNIPLPRSVSIVDTGRGDYSPSFPTTKSRTPLVFCNRALRQAAPPPFKTFHPPTSGFPVQSPFSTP